MKFFTKMLTAASQKLEENKRKQKKAARGKKKGSDDESDDKVKKDEAAESKTGGQKERTDEEKKSEEDARAEEDDENDETPVSHISERLQSLCCNEKFANIWFVVGRESPERIPAHKAILAARSEVFAAMYGFIPRCCRSSSFHY